MKEKYISPGFRNRVLPPLIDPAEAAADAFRTAFGIKKAVPRTSQHATEAGKNTKKLSEVSQDYSRQSDTSAVGPAWLQTGLSKADELFQKAFPNAANSKPSAEAYVSRQQTSPANAGAAFSRLGSDIGTATGEAYTKAQSAAPSAYDIAGNNKLITDWNNEAQWHEKYGTMTSAEAYSAADLLPNGYEKEWLTNQAMLSEVFETTDISPSDPLYNDKIMLAYLKLQYDKGSEQFEIKRENDMKYAQKLKDDFDNAWAPLLDSNVVLSESQRSRLQVQYETELEAMKAQHKLLMEQGAAHETDFVRLHDDIVSLETQIRIQETIKKALTKDNQLEVGREALDSMLRDNQSLKNAYNSDFANPGTATGELPAADEQAKNLAAYNAYMSEAAASRQTIFDVGEFVNRLENIAAAEESRAAWEAFVKKHPDLAFILRPAMSMIDSVSSTAQVLADATNPSRYKIGDPNAAGYRMGDFVDITDQEMVSKLGTVGTLLYKVGMDFLDNRIQKGLKIPKHMLVINGLGKFSEGYKESTRAGRSKTDAYTTNLISATVNMLSTKNSDNLFRYLDDLDGLIGHIQDVAQANKAILTDNEATLVGTLLQDSLSVMNSSQCQLQIRAMMQNEGLSWREAQSKMLQELTLSYLDLAMDYQPTNA